MNRWRLLWVTLGCIQFAILLFFGYRLFEEYREFEFRSSKKAALQYEKKDLAQKIEKRRDFLDRLARDPSFQDSVVRRELGYAKDGEQIFRFPSAQDGSTPPSN